MKKLLMLSVICCVFCGCALTNNMPAMFEVQSANLANEVRAIRQEFRLYKDAAKAAAELEEDKQTLNDLGKILDKDMEKAHENALDLNKKIKEFRDE